MRSLPFFDVPPYRFSGTVLGTLLNHRAALAALGDAAYAPPYKGPPRAPVLYVKPRNTLAADGDVIEVPDGVDEIEIGAALGIVVGRTACRIRKEDARACIAGYTIVNDVSVPHASFYRPSLRFKVRDGFCPLGSTVVAAAAIADPDALAVRVRLDGALVHSTSTQGMVRPVAKLLAEVSEFMILAPGDVLMLGVAAGAPRARRGQEVVVEIDGVGRLTNRLVGTSS